METLKSEKNIFTPSLNKRENKVEDILTQFENLWDFVDKNYWETKVKPVYKNSFQRNFTSPN